MTLSQTQARDQIATLVKTATDAIAAFGVNPDESENVIWDDTRRDIPSEESPPATWARVTVRHLTSEQASLSDEAGVRRYTRRGQVTVQIFTPLKGDGLVAADSIASAIQGAFLGVSTPNGVWFRSVRTNEVGIDGSWFQTNVLAEFQYDEVR